MHFFRSYGGSEGRKDTMRRTIQSAACLLAILVASAHARAQAASAKRPLTVEDVLERPGADLPSLTWLPDSDRLLFTLGHYYEPQKTVILSTKTGARREITGLQLNFGGSVQLSPDKTRLAYVKDGWVWTQPLDGSGEPTKVAQVDLALDKAYNEAKVFCFGEGTRAIYFTQRPKRP